MRHALVVMGVAGAGKSRIGAALAEALHLSFIEGDTFHSAVNVAKMAAGTPLTDDDRRAWLLALAEQLQLARAQGTGIVLTCSALKRRYRDVLRAGDDSIRFIVLTGTPAMLRERIAMRTAHYMPASLLESQLATLELPTADEHALTFDVQHAPDAIVAAILARLHTDGARRTR
jgi:gluconokinase